MAYIRYKEVTREFNFTRYVEAKNVPLFVREYIYGDEILLAAYKVGKDHGIITDKKIVLFDNTQSFGRRKEITTIPYRAITAHSVIFRPTAAEIYLLLETSNPMLLKFSGMRDTDKLRLRYLYNAMSASINNQPIPVQVLEKLVNNDFNFNDGR